MRHFNLKPEEVQFLLTRVTAGFLDFDWSAQKIYGTPDTSGMCPSENFHVCRHQVDGQGRPLNSPWQITISNGKGIKIANQNGGFYMKGGSYREGKKASINLTDLDFYTLLKRADSYISAFEKSAETQRIISEGKSAFEDLLNAKKAQERQYNGYGTIPEPPQSPVYQTDPNATYPQQQTYGQAIGEAQRKPSGQGYPQQAQQTINQYYAHIRTRDSSRIRRPNCYYR